MRKSLDELKNLILSPLASTNSEVFHEITDILLVDYLDFRNILERYQVDQHRLPLYHGTIEAENIDKVRDVHNKLISEGITPKNYAKRLTYERNGDNVVTFSHHETLDDLLNNKLRARSILSTTDFNLGKNITIVSDVKYRFDSEARMRGLDPMYIAFEKDYIVLLPNFMYALHPKHLHEAAKRNI